MPTISLAVLFFFLGDLQMTPPPDLAIRGIDLQNGTQVTVTVANFGGPCTSPDKKVDVALEYKNHYSLPTQRILCPPRTYLKNKINTVAVKFTLHEKHKLESGGCDVCPVLEARIDKDPAETNLKNNIASRNID